MRNLYLSLFVLLVTFSRLTAQPPNDVCNTAIELTDVVSWCSHPAAFSHTNAQDEGTVAKPFCFFDTPNYRDVWFSFTAIGNTVNVSVTGAYDTGVQGVGGTMKNPNIAIYSGTC